MKHYYKHLILHIRRTREDSRMLALSLSYRSICTGCDYELWIFLSFRAFSLCCYDLYQFEAYFIYYEYEK